LTAPETIDVTTHIVGAIDQNLNSLCDPTTPVLGVIYDLWATFNLSNKVEVFISTHYEDMNGDTKCRK